ncbi:MAG: hypothetical protein IT423_06185 [Pirellulaceae bacterium]|nr:hypothetical protein [Pirellulaceae bacterium]
MGQQPNLRLSSPTQQSRWLASAWRNSIRRISRWPNGSWLLVAILALPFAGCDAKSGAEPLSPEILAAREQYMLAAEPTDPILIAEARKLPAKSPVVIVGRLGVAGQSTWEKGKAMFVVSDAHPKLAGHKHKDGEDESDCPFCKRSQNERLSIVQIADEKGDVASLDAQALLDAVEGQEVVVQGTAEVNELDMLVINATGIFVRR